MSKLFVSKRTRAAAWVILLVLPALMVAFGYYPSHRPAVNPVGSRTFWDYVSLNSDILLGLLFLRPIAVLLGAQGAMLEDCVVYGGILLAFIGGKVVCAEHDNTDQHRQNADCEK